MSLTDIEKNEDFDMASSTGHFLNLFYSGKNIEQLELVVNNEIKKISEWFKNNQLTQMNYIVFKSKKKKLKYEIKITIENDNLAHVKNTKFLGMIIDHHLTWNDHINYVANKIAKTTGILNKTRNFLKIDTLTTLFHSLIYPYPSKLKKILKIKYQKNKRFMYKKEIQNGNENIFVVSRQTITS